MNVQTDFLAATPAFAGIDHEVLAELVGAAEPRTLDADTVLFRAGDEFHDEVYLLRRGRIEVRRGDGTIESPPDGYLIGLSSFLADSPYMSTAVAAEASEILAIPATRLRDLERRHPPLFEALNRLIANRLREQTLAPPSASGPLVAPVGSVMTAPVAKCGADTPLRSAIEQMATANVGSLAVVDGDGAALGLLTWRSAALHLLDHPEPDRALAGDAYRDAGTVGVSTPLWQAQERLRRDRVKHLIVTDDGLPVGILSLTDTVRHLVASRGGVDAAVGTATTPEDLRKRFDGIVNIAAESLERNRFARMAVAVVSAAHLAIQRRCVELTLAAIEADGHGPPPAPYALIVMGSGGRREMMLDPDQDNGIIVGEGGRRVTEWFARFCERFNENLDRAGYPLCPGDIMARNPTYRRTLEGWKKQITRLVTRPSDRAARWSNIVFDFDTLHGDERLAGALRRHLHDELGRDSRLLQLMVEDDAQGRAPLNLFNRLVATGKRDGIEIVDVKRNGLRIVADAARILALRAAIPATNTSDRLAALARDGEISAGFEATVSSAYDKLLEILLAHQIRQRRAGTTTDKAVAPELLTPPEREALRVAMRAVKRFQDYLQDHV